MKPKGRRRRQLDDSGLWVWRWHEVLSTCHVSCQYAVPILQSLWTHTQSPVAFAISSPTFFGERPRGPILGAKADEAPTSPPVALRWLPVSIKYQYGSPDLRRLLTAIDGVVCEMKFVVAEEWITYITLISLGSSFGAGENCQSNGLRGRKSQNVEKYLRIFTFWSQGWGTIGVGMDFLESNLCGFSLRFL